MLSREGLLLLSISCKGCLLVDGFIFFLGAGASLSSTSKFSSSDASIWVAFFDFAGARAGLEDASFLAIFGFVAVVALGAFSWMVVRRSQGERDIMRLMTLVIG